jgi:hypothetical protein
LTTNLIIHYTNHIQETANLETNITFNWGGIYVGH